MVSMNIVKAATGIMALAMRADAAPSHLVARNDSGLSLTTQLQIADTTAQRYQLLSKDEDFIFDFNKAQVPIANRETFPALTGTGTSLALGNMDGCSMAFLHVHPRAHELFSVTSGRVVTEMVPEAGIVDADGKPRVIRSDLGPNMVTLFPQGSFHLAINPECDKATVAVVFTSEDPGTGLVPSQTFAFSEDVISNQFGGSIAGEDIDKVRDAIPQGMQVMIDGCLASCGKQKREA